MRSAPSSIPRSSEMRSPRRADERRGDPRAGEGSQPHRPLRCGMGRLTAPPPTGPTPGVRGGARVALVASGSMFAIIMAGGAGTRLWPLSRRSTPKQLLALTGDTSLLQQTVARVATLLKPHDIYVITSQAHVRATQEQLPQLPA